MPSYRSGAINCTISITSVQKTVTPDAVNRGFSGDLHRLVIEGVDESGAHHRFKTPGIVVNKEGDYVEGPSSWAWGWMDRVTLEPIVSVGQIVEVTAVQKDYTTINRVRREDSWRIDDDDS